MTRKIYRDFLEKKAREGQWIWLARAGGRYLRVLASQAAGRPFCGPVLATLVTNYTCNFRCLMCDMPRRGRELAAQGTAELSTADLKDMLQDLRDLGALGVGFTGGEPLLRPDIFELLAHARALGMITHLNTNGSLVDEKTAARMLEAGVDSLNVSIDGARPATHDAVRGVSGAFKKACETVRLVDRLRRERRQGIRIKIVTVVSDRNVEELPDLLALARDLGTDCSEFIPEQPFLARPGAGPSPKISPSERLLASPRLLVRAKKAKERIDNSYGMLDLFRPSFSGRASPLRCFAGYNSIAVDNYGEIYPCLPWLNWGRSVGNIRDRRLKFLWCSVAYGRVREKVRRCRDCFLNCQAELNLLFQPWKSLIAGRRIRATAPGSEQR